MVIGYEFLQRKAELAHIVSASGLTGSILDGGQCGKKEAGQYGNYGDYHQ